MATVTMKEEELDIIMKALSDAEKVLSELGFCKNCYYAVNDATLCEMHTRVNCDGDVCEFDIEPDFYCANFKKKEDDE